MKREDIERFVNRIDDLACALEEYTLLLAAHCQEQTASRVGGMVPDIIGRNLHEVAKEMHGAARAQ